MGRAGVAYGKVQIEGGVLKGATCTVSAVEGIIQGSTQLLEMRSATTHSWNRNIAAKHWSLLQPQMQIGMDVVARVGKAF